MSVYKPKNSRVWHYDFQWQGRRFYGSTGQTSRRSAEQFEVGERRKATLGETEKRGLTVDQAFGTWFEARGRHTKTAKTVEGQIAVMVAAFGKSVPFEALTIGDYDGLVAKLLGKGRKSATANRYVELARRVTRYTASRGYAVPVIKWGDILLSEPKERSRELSTDEEARLFAKLPHDLAQVVRFAIMSGLRRSALIRLRWNDVDLHARRLTYTNKGGASEMLPLTDAMVAHIANQPKVGPFVFTYECERTAPKRPGRTARIKGNRYPFSKQGWARKWRRALKEAGVEDYRFHDNRHTFGSRVTRASGNLKVTQKLMAHTNIATTTRYVHALEDDMRDALFAAESRNSPERLNVVSSQTRRNRRKKGN